MNVWILVSVIFLTVGLKPQALKDFSNIKVFSEQDKYQAQTSRKNIDDNIVRPVRKSSDSLGVVLTATSAVAGDVASGEVLWEKSASEIRSIASISKLMTALVFLENNPGWSEPITMEVADEIGGDTANIKREEVVTVRDLFMASLIASDNNATMALVRSTGLSSEDFVRQMNAKAKALGLNSTHFVEPVGLNADNKSTALEIFKLARTAFANKEISSATSQKNYSFTAISGQSHKIKSTNGLLGAYLNVVSGKTGFTEQAGHCVVVEVSDSEGHKIISVVLGSASNDDRFRDAKILSAWVLANFSWPKQAN